MEKKMENVMETRIMNSRIFAGPRASAARGCGPRVWI